MSKQDIYKAFAEVNDIVMNSEESIQQKIPYKLKKIFKDNADINYNITINYSKNINEQQLLPETRDILAMIYRDYLCSEQEKKFLIEKQIEYDKKVQEKYDITKILEQRASNDEVNYNVNQNSQEKALTCIDNKKWYQKIWIHIKKIFKKDK